MPPSNEKQTVDEWFAQVQGKMDAVVLACTSMIATHPEKKAVLALLLRLAESAGAGSEDSPQKRSYKLGIQQAVSGIVKGVETAQLADEIRDLKASSGSH